MGVLDLVDGRGMKYERMQFIAPVLMQSDSRDSLLYNAGDENPKWPNMRPKNAKFAE